MKLNPTPKIAQKDQKTQKVSNWAKSKNILTFKAVLQMVVQSPKKVFEPDPNPKNSPERPQKCKKGPKFGRIKNKKDRAILQEPKLIVYIGGSQKRF